MIIHDAYAECAIPSLHIHYRQQKRGIATEMLLEDRIIPSRNLVLKLLVHVSKIRSRARAQTHNNTGLLVAYARVGL